MIRRPAYMTHSCPAPGSDDIWDDFIPSRETVLKSQTARKYLEEHFQTLIEETQESQSRMKLFKETIDNSDLLPKDKEALYAQFLSEENKIRRSARTRLKPSRFQKIRLIGKGGFGQVWLVQDKMTTDLYALKVLRKADIILQDQLVNVHTEREILSQCGNQWVVPLRCSFQDPEKLYLVLDYMCGGDLMTALIKLKVFNESVTRFFVGEIAVALHSVHQMHFLHRDLKPDNVLIDKDGHIKLADFGLSTSYRKTDTQFQNLLDELQQLLLEHSQVGVADPVTHHVRGTAIGTCDYTAPEILQGQEPTTASDFWSLGVIMYEMLYGHSPFSGRSPTETALRITHWQKALRFQPKPQTISDEAIDLIKHLLCAPEQRYGFQEILAHPFFSGFHFDNIKLNPAPLVPIIKYPTDTSHFDAYENDEDRGGDLPGGDLAKVAFWGYTFRQRQRNSTLTRLGASLFVD
jgi:serine/threonine protein kinase